MFYAGILLASLTALTPAHHHHFFPNTTFSVKWYNNSADQTQLQNVSEYTCDYDALTPYDVSVSANTTQTQLGSYAGQCGANIYIDTMWIEGHADKYYCSLILRVDTTSGTGLQTFEWVKGGNGTESYCSNNFGNSSYSPNVIMYFSIVTPTETERR